VSEHPDEKPRKFARGPAADLWRRTLAQLPTAFGRLAYLASLRNANTGMYEHHGLAQIYGAGEADRTLRESHQQVFLEWLCFRLERQKDEIAEYLEGLETTPGLAIENWIRFAPYRNFVPIDTREAERRLYLSDLDLVMELLRVEHGVASPDPES
jgi:hypothetical protein